MDSSSKPSKPQQSIAKQDATRDLSGLLAGGGKVFLSTASLSAGEAAAEVYRPNELLRGIIAEQVRQRTGAEPLIRNPHFTDLQRMVHGATVIHFSGIDESCPVPGATNVQFLSRHDLLLLAQERLNRQRAQLMHHVLGCMDYVLPLNEVQDRGVLVTDGAKGPALLAPMDRLPALPEAPGKRGRPVAVQAAAYQTGPYNYLNNPNRPADSSIHLPILIEGLQTRKRPYAMVLATPDTVHEICLLMRVFAALRSLGSAVELLVVFFGTPGQMAEAIRQQPQAAFFNDNFTAPGVRCLFSPFHEGDLFGALRGAKVVFDPAYGGVVEALAAPLGLAWYFTIDANGRYLEHQAGAAPTGELNLGSLLDEAVIRRRDHKADRGPERRLLLRLQQIFGAAA